MIIVLWATVNLFFFFLVKFFFFFLFCGLPVTVVRYAWTTLAILLSVRDRCFTSLQCKKLHSHLLADILVES